MVDAIEAMVLLTALVFGAIAFFSFVLTPLLFARRPAEEVGDILRPVFPVYYGVNGLLAAGAAGIGYQWAPFSAGLLAVVAAGAAYQGLFLHWMAARAKENRDVDSRQARRFRRLHWQSLLINLLMWLLAGWVLVRLAAEL